MKSIAVVSYNYQQYSETFINHLVKNLPFKVHYMYGGELPAFYGDYRPFLPEKGWGRWYVETKALLGKKTQEQQEEAVEQYLLKNNIEAVHTNYSITALPLMDICERNNIPLIVHFRGWTAYRQTILDKYGAQYPKLFRIATAVICVSEDMKRQLIHLGCPENKITIIASGADTAYFRYQNHSANPPVFLSVGRFCDTKNPHLTILAFSKVLQDIPDAKLVMAGGNETLLSACFTLCKALKIENDVMFKGVLTHEEVAEEMKNAYAFVQHSATTILKEKEGTPNAIMEAMASGLPVVATRHAGIKDIITHGETGLLRNEYDIDAMAKHMIQIWNYKEFATQIGINASEHISKNYTRKLYLDKVAEIITFAIENKK